MASGFHCKGQLQLIGDLMEYSSNLRHIDCKMPFYLLLRKKEVLPIKLRLLSYYLEFLFYTYWKILFALFRHNVIF